MRHAIERIQKIRFWECDACFTRFKDSTLNKVKGFCPSCGFPEFTAVRCEFCGTEKEVMADHKEDHLTDQSRVDICKSCRSTLKRKIHGTKGTITENNRITKEWFREIIEGKRDDVKGKEDPFPTSTTMSDKKIDEYPYQTYEEAKRKVVERDDFTCQVCGLESRMGGEGTIKYCKKCFDRGIPFQPAGDRKPPRKCDFRGELSKCSECEFFRKVKVKVLPLTHTVEGYIFHFDPPHDILAHHLDGNPRNNKTII